jgi:hypothetical protein
MRTRKLDHYTLIIGTKSEIRSNKVLNKHKHDLNYAHRESQKELMRVEFAVKLFL